MHLARIRRTAESTVELAARTADGRLLPLPDLPADPVALLAERGATALADEIAGRPATGLLDPDDVVFEPPVAFCSKICCLALNYQAHADESKMQVPPEPVLFFKPPSALIGHNQTVRAPARTAHLEHEVELAIVIGKTVKDLPADRWAEAVAGYTVINDMTARDLQLANIARNQPWDQFKGFDTFAPLGPFLATPDEIDDPQRLDLTLTVGGQVRQQANTAQMVFDIPRLIADLSDGMTLCPGDVIATGTIAGIAPLSDGDVMSATVTGVGTLVNRVEFAH
jgi:5-oxopent-3-ene-1,2,5-tricarboxylate decarboxylase/2-hydroxyhepta-2,4-diene-1,7-dioate isomerase